MLKKSIALILASLLVFSLFGGCGGGKFESAQTEAPATKPKATQPEEEKKVMKILTLGSSSSVDACHMLNLVAAKEGVEQELVVGTLYYSGCTLTQHVQFLTQNSPVYMLYLSSSATPNSPPTTTDNVTMQMALRQDCWDIVILQGAGFETMEDIAFTNGNVETIKEYVNKKKLNPEMVFAYHAIGISSTDPELTATYPYDNNPYSTNAIKWNYDRARMYQERVSRLERFVETDKDYQYRIYSITAVENAITSYLGQKGIKRDYTHLTDLGRLIAAYSVYCELYGVDELTEIKVDAIPKNFLKSTVNKSVDLVLTDAEKAIVLEAVNNTLKNPLEITPSQYTQAPAQ